MKSLKYVLVRQIAFQSACKANNWSIAYIEDLEEIIKQKRGWTKTCIYMICNNCTKSQKVAIKSILNHKNWCKSCIALRLRKYDIQWVREFVKDKYDGKCLSNIVEKTTDKLEFQCKNGHRWYNRLNNIIAKHWCHICKTKKYSIEYVHEFVHNEFNGRCLSKSMINTRSGLLFQCENNHIWQTSFNKILQKKWCRKCYLKNATLSLDDAKLYATQNNGELLSTEYINIRTKLKWKCENNHIWEAHLNSIKNGTWCPSCYSTGSFYENITKLTYKELFNQIPSTNRQILNGIELDGYLEFDNIKHAFEVHGQQHNEFIKFFHKTYSRFIWQLERDDKRRMECFKKEIYLLEFCPPEKHSTKNVIEYINTLIPFIINSKLGTYAIETDTDIIRDRVLDILYNEKK